MKVAKIVPRGGVSLVVRRVVGPGSGPAPRVAAVVTATGVTAREGDGRAAEPAAVAGFNLAGRPACSVWIAWRWWTIRTSLASGVTWRSEARLSRGASSVHALGTNGQ